MPMSLRSGLLEVDNLHVTLSTPKGDLDIVRGVSFNVGAGECVGLVGESGSGKSMTGMALLGLLPQPQGRISQGTISFDGRNLAAIKGSEMRALRGAQLAMIFQDPMSSLSPFYTIGAQIREAILCHQKSVSKSVATRLVLDLLKEVGIADPLARMNQYPHQFSGGMRQRVMIAMALANGPRLLIADEPTTALDVTIQAQILALLAEKQKSHGLSMLLVSHDWSVIKNMCDRVLVMYAGRIVEEGTVAQLQEAALHPYTQGLLASLPHWGMPNNADLPVIPGHPPTPQTNPKGCSFAPRCPKANVTSCRTEQPTCHTLGTNRRVSCGLI